jgi:predicted ATP-grasp superfamily ATP-dependent carboligase
MRGTPALLVKPRSQVFYASQAKGSIVTKQAQLRRSWRAYRASLFAPEIGADIPDVGYPMVQEYLSQARTAVDSVSGFIDHSGNILASCGSTKILQLPRDAGVGLCFEAFTPDATVLLKIRSLCMSTGYFGVFEVEFVRHEGRRLLIDFNPRYFGQMGFDIARGRELPWLVHLCAIGQQEDAMRFAGQIPAGAAATCFADSMALKWFLLAGTVLGVFSFRDRRKWLRWLEADPAGFRDMVLLPGDSGPSLAAVAGRLWRSARYPIGFLRSLQRSGI